MTEAARGRSVSLIVAMDEGGLIGRAGQLPWRLPEDLKHFRRLTLGKTILMGRKTFESLGKPLDGRANWVLSRAVEFRPAGCHVFTDLESALSAHQAGELMVIGGADLFRQALPLAQRIYLTRVHARLAGDTFFPDVSWQEWHETERRELPADERHAWPLAFLTLERK
jgi:dihydrofolate reductase